MYLIVRLETEVLWNNLLNSLQTFSCKVRILLTTQYNEKLTS